MCIHGKRKGRCKEGCPASRRSKCEARQQNEIIQGRSTPSTCVSCASPNSPPISADDALGLDSLLSSELVSMTSESSNLPVFGAGEAFTPELVELIPHFQKACGPMLEEPEGRTFNHGGRPTVATTIRPGMTVHEIKSKDLTKSKDLMGSAKGTPVRPRVVALPIRSLEGPSHPINQPLLLLPTKSTLQLERETSCSSTLTAPFEDDADVSLNHPCSFATSSLDCTAARPVNLAESSQDEPTLDPLTGYWMTILHSGTVETISSAPPSSIKFSDVPLVVDV